MLISHYLQMYIFFELSDFSPIWWLNGEILRRTQPFEKEINSKDFMFKVETFEYKGYNCCKRLKCYFLNAWSSKLRKS